MKNKQKRMSIVVEDEEKNQFSQLTAKYAKTHQDDADEEEEEDVMNLSWADMEDENQLLMFESYLKGVTTKEATPKKRETSKEKKDKAKEKEKEKEKEKQKEKERQKEKEKQKQKEHDKEQPIRTRAKRSTSLTVISTTDITFEEEAFAKGPAPGGIRKKDQQRRRSSGLTGWLWRSNEEFHLALTTSAALEEDFSYDTARTCGQIPFPLCSQLGAEYKKLKGIP